VSSVNSEGSGTAYFKLPYEESGAWENIHDMRQLNKLRKLYEDLVKLLRKLNEI
jgi:hypothetical protein